MNLNKKRKNQTKFPWYEGVGKIYFLPWYILKHTVISVICVFVFFGACLFYEAAVPEIVPEFKILHYSSGIDPYYRSNGYLIKDGYSHEERYRGLENALAILDATNPAVADWVRKQNEINKLVFYERKNQNTSCFNATNGMAKFNYFNRTLYIHKGVFAESDGTIAVTLAHEYRHSRQSYTKPLRYSLSTFFTKGGNANLVEDEAVLYEMKGFSAIFGPGYAN